jgi:hypothetical protein
MRRAIDTAMDVRTARVARTDTVSGPRQRQRFEGFGLID